MKIRNILITSISTFIFGASIIGGGILTQTNADVDKLELLTRAIENDSLNELQRARGDINIQAGLEHAGAIIDNTLYMWGGNEYGQLGTGDGNKRSKPTRINIPSGELKELALGNFFSGIIVGGSVYTWGKNNYGQLGLGDQNSRSTPTLMNRLAGAHSLALGGNHAGAIAQGKVYMWGDNRVGQIGDDTYGDENYRTAPTPVSERYIEGMTAVQLSLGDFHSGAIYTDPEEGNKGKLFAWGYNWNGQLGYYTRPKRDWDEEPYRVKDVNKLGSVTYLSFGHQNSSAIVNGDLYVWGDNTCGQLGLGYTSRWEWAKKSSLTGVVAVKFSPTFNRLWDYDLPGYMLALTSSGQLYASGDNRMGQLGSGGTVSTSTSKEILSGVTHIAAGNIFSVAIVNGKLNTWGANDVGQLAGNTSKNPTKPGIVNINENFLVNLNSSNDLGNIRSKVVYNCNDTDLKDFIEHYGTSMNLPKTYNLQNTTKVGSVADGHGRITTQIDAAFPITTNITINGFLPVKETALTKIDPVEVPLDDNTFVNQTLSILVSEANTDSTGTKSTLAQWIIKNSSLIIGNHSTYTQDFPMNARITRVDGFTASTSIFDGVEFNIYVDKYYEKSGTNLTLSTSNVPVKILQKVVLTGLPNAISYQDCIDPKTGKIAILETQINPQISADKFFEAITGDVDGGVVINRFLLGQYINTRFIPADAEVILVRDSSIIQDPNQLAQTVAFTLITNKYFWNSALIAPPSPPLTEYITFVITKQESSISVKDDIDGITSIISTGDALDEMLLDKLIFFKDSSKYFNFTNFPLNTVFTLERVINNFNEDGILELSIKADNYYETTSLNPMYQSKLFSVTIKGFKPSHDIDVYPVVTSQNQKIELDLTKDQFYNQILVDNIPNRAFIGQYIDLRAIPSDANLSITKMQYNDDGTITLSIKSDKYYNDGGTTINLTYEATVLVVLPVAIDLTLIISLCAGGAFLIFLIVCIILTMRNKNKLKSKQ